MKYDPFRLADRIPYEPIRRRALDLMLTVGIPFNRWLGLRLGAVEPGRVQVLSPESTLRRNHVGGAHACALALIGEYAAGLVIAQQFPIERFRVIIGELKVRYHKQGRGLLKGEAVAPEAWPSFDDEGQAWVPMTTRIQNEKGDLVAECETLWQVKEWNRVHAT